MPTRMHADRVVATLAARQWGVVARRQLLDLGLTHAMVGERVRSGRLLPLHRGVYAVGHARLRREGHWLAAVLAVGTGAVLSHRDAAGLHDLRPANHAHVDVTTLRQPRSIRGISIHRTTVLDAQDITTIHGISTTTVARTLVDLAGHVPQDHLAKAVREAERRHAFDLREVEAALARTRGRRGRGHRAMREAIAECAAFEHSPTRSPLEDAFLRLVRGSRLPLPSTNALVEGFEVDAVWRAQRVAVELDGWTDHQTRRAFEADRERDAVLMAAGWRVIRVTHRQLGERPDHVLSTLRRLGIR
jgi:very-short-patch-repair endonuclease